MFRLSVELNSGGPATGAERALGGGVVPEQGPLGVVSLAFSGNLEGQCPGAEGCQWGRYEAGGASWGVERLENHRRPQQQGAAGEM